jgi:uncharacterized protein with HEPN domain
MYKEGRDITDFIQDILNSIKEIEEFTKGMTYEDFRGDNKTCNAVIRSLEVLGEATKRIPLALRNEYKEIPWKKMAGLRDVLIHEYMGVDIKTVWNVVTKRIPEIKPLIEKVKEEIKSKTKNT